MDQRRYLLAIANRMTPRWLRKRLDPDDLVQDTLLEAVRCGKLEQGAWIAEALRNNIYNAIRDNRAAKRDLRCEVSVDDIGKVRRQAIPKNRGSRCRHYGTYSSEPSPVFMAMFAEAAVVLTAAQWRFLLFGEEELSANAARMRLERAEAKFRASI